MDLQAYEDPAQGALDFTQELDPAWLVVDTVIGEGEPWGPLCAVALELPAHPCRAQLASPLARSSQMSFLPALPEVLAPL